MFLRYLGDIVETNAVLGFPIKESGELTVRNRVFGIETVVDMNILPDSYVLAISA